MNRRITLIFILGVILSITFSFGQNSSASKMIQKIDSIARVKNIKMAMIRTNQVSSTFDHPSTDAVMLVRKDKFFFDGEFLVVDDKYFNMNKLLYFYIRNNYFEFYFQSI